MWNGGKETGKAMEIKKPFQLDVVSVRLVKEAPLFSKRKIQSPEDAVEVIGGMLCEMDREVVCVVNLKTGGAPINCNIVSIGALNMALSEPRELFKSAILSNAANLLLVHNHPSGDPAPSREDVMITDRMARLGLLLGIPLADHVITGGNDGEYFSFRERGLMRLPKIAYTSELADIQFTPGPLVSEKRRGR